MSNATTTVSPRAKTTTKPTTASNGKPKRSSPAKRQELDGAIAEYRKAIGDYRHMMAQSEPLADILRRLATANKSVSESMRSLGVETLERDGETFGDGRTVIDFPASPSGRPWCQVAVTDRRKDGTGFRKWYVFCNSPEDWKLLVESEPYFAHFGMIEFAFGVMATAQLSSLWSLMEMSGVYRTRPFLDDDELFRFLTESPFATPFPQR